jgi:hypothetical protein
MNSQEGKNIGKQGEGNNSSPSSYTHCFVCSWHGGEVDGTSNLSLLAELWWIMWSDGKYLIEKN